MGVKLAKMEALQRPNLLLNADYRQGIVNQRGQQTYVLTNNDYPYEMWRIGGYKQTITINEGYVRVTNNVVDRYCLLDQFVYIKKNRVQNETFTLAFRIRASAKAKFRLYSTDRYFEVDTTWKTIIITFKGSEIDIDSLHDNFFVCWIGCVSYINPTVNNLPLGFWFDFEFAKLEYGDTFTGMPIWNGTSETEKCKEFFQIVDFQETIWSDMYENEFIKRITLPVSMRRKPSLTYTIFDNYNVTSQKAASENASSFFVSYKLSSQAGIGHRVGLQIILNAYDY